MTQDQREILATNVEGDGTTYDIVTIEYPASIHGDLKIVTRQHGGTQLDVDIYDKEGRTYQAYSVTG